MTFPKLFHGGKAYIKKLYMHSYLQLLFIYFSPQPLFSIKACVDKEHITLSMS